MDQLWITGVVEIQDAFSPLSTGLFLVPHNFLQETSMWLLMHSVQSYKCLIDSILVTYTANGTFLTWSHIGLYPEICDFRLWIYFSQASDSDLKFAKWQKRRTNSNLNSHSCISPHDGNSSWPNIMSCVTVYLQSLPAWCEQAHQLLFSTIVWEKVKKHSILVGL